MPILPGGEFSFLACSETETTWRQSAEKQVRTQSETVAIHSISVRAPKASPLAPSALRAGGLTAKYSV